MMDCGENQDTEHGNDDGHTGTQLHLLPMGEGFPAFLSTDSLRVQVLCICFHVLFSFRHGESVQSCLL